MKQHNPNSYKLPRRDSSNSWSELPPDLLNLVLERLGVADSRRAESVCSSWYSAARRCLAKKQIPWLILLPDEDDRMNNHWCKLFNPEEKDKLYKIRDEDVEFAKSYCLASYGNWLFMVDCWYNLYLLNLFTHERIDLPPVESQLGTTKLERTSKGFFNKYEQVGFLGNEAMLFDLGITVLANDDIEMEPLHKFDCSSLQQLARALWFLPSFKQT
ncbi:unnamed protein product [Thlaspi arvense]|uniref:F-box domain-containing protein n=1 Tax=Thlaspi arvense TaxID=13288 RepID=A0AAU9RV78_THLAR|nr:unnamed protein product [Thlaspi arvense]